MKIHEYQAKAVFARFGVPVPRGEMATSAEEAGAIAKRLGGTVVVKSQIHAGGRRNHRAADTWWTVDDSIRLSSLRGDAAGVPAHFAH